MIAPVAELVDPLLTQLRDEIETKDEIIATLSKRLAKLQRESKHRERCHRDLELHIEQSELPRHGRQVVDIEYDAPEIVTVGEDVGFLRQAIYEWNPE